MCEVLPVFNTYLGQAECTPKLREALFTFRPSDVSFAVFPNDFYTYIDTVQKMVSHLGIYLRHHTLNSLLLGLY